MRPTVSIVIPAYNEEDSIASCLASLASQRTHRPFEVIVVDNGSTDATMDVAGKFHDRLTLRIIREAKKGRGAARRTGCSAARGDIILSTDADAFLPPNWIESLVGTLDRSPETVAVTGVSAIEDCPAYVNAIYNISLPILMRMYRLVFGYYILAGCNFAVRSWAYQRAGGFDAEEDALEDDSLSRRVRRLGSIRFTGHSRVVVSGRRFQSGLLRGAAAYPASYVRKVLLGRKRVILKDMR